MDKFWMVWVDGERGPARPHSTRDEAYKEAERLTRKTGNRTFVLEAITFCQFKKEPVEWIGL